MISEMEREAALEVYKQKDLEVLYLDEPYAELCFSKIFDFEGVKLRSVQKAGDLRINWKTEETDRYNDLKKMYKPLTKWWEKNAGKAGVPINKVEVSRRLVDSPAVVLATEYGMSARQERIKKVQEDESDESLLDTANLVAQTAVLASNYDLEDPEILVQSVYDLVALEHNLDPKADVTPIEVELPEEPAKVEDDDDEDDEEDGADEEEAKDGDKPEL